LRTAHVRGIFTISNGTYDPSNEFESPNYARTSNGCEGSGSYSDLNSITQVIVTDNHGAEVAPEEYADHCEPPAALNRAQHVRLIHHDHHLRGPSQRRTWTRLIPVGRRTPSAVHRGRRRASRPPLRRS